MNLKLSEINLPIEKQFYLLKHFRYINKEYEINLIDEYGYSKKDIQKLLNTSGSKFTKEFANNPKELWDKII